MIRDAVKSIKDGAFSHCRRLDTSTLGDGLEDIGEKAFWCSRSLQHIVIPNAVKAIQKRAFSNCTDLMTVTFGGRLKEIGEKEFGHAHR